MPLTLRKGASLINLRFEVICQPYPGLPTLLLSNSSFLTALRTAFPHRGQVPPAMVRYVKRLVRFASLGTWRVSSFVPEAPSGSRLRPYFSGVRLPRELSGRSPWYSRLQRSIGFVASPSVRNQWIFQHFFLRFCVETLDECVPHGIYGRNEVDPCSAPSAPSLNRVRGELEAVAHLDRVG